jgi:vancomycin resistance protein YoaR
VIESPPADARFVVDAKEHVEIVPSQPAARIDMRMLGEAVLAAAAAPERRGTLPIVASSEQPALTTEQAQSLGIRRLLSTFTTRHPCCERRVENIHRIADLLDGLVVKPGETVSVNAIVGPRTTKNGFVLAPTIEEGEMVDTVGGGISQFATTLFNALFYGGFDILERQPHTYWFPRYPMGHEATLSYPKPDLVFRNDTDFGMLIDTAYTKTTITVRIFGDNGGRKVRALVSARQNVVEPPVEILGNPEVLPEEERVRESGMIGWSVTVGRILTFPDGTKKEEGRKVTYRPRTRRVEVHPCRVPKGEKGYTGERCPELQDSAELAIAPEPERRSNL